jgi:uncharacterized protein
MDFEWDEDKFWSNLEKHGVNFAEAALIFEGEVVTKADPRQDYGEVRLISIGRAEGQFYVVVHTARAGVTRIISARLGGRRDREYYYTHVAG